MTDITEGRLGIVRGNHRVLERGEMRDMMQREKEKKDGTKIGEKGTG